MKKWIAKTTDDIIITEDEINWGHVDPKNITELKIDNDGQIISLPNGLNYVQGKTASVMFGNSECEIESRYIGIKLGNNIVKVRVDEKTNNINIEVE